MSTTLNIPNYAATYLKRFANQSIPASQTEVRYRFIEAVERLFSGQSNVADLWEHLGYNLDSYTDISRRRPGHLLFWSDGSSEGLGVVLNDTDKMLQLDPAASGTLPTLNVAGRVYLGGLDVGGFAMSPLVIKCSKIAEAAEAWHINIRLPLLSLYTSLLADPANTPASNLVVLNTEASNLWNQHHNKSWFRFFEKIQSTSGVTGSGLNPDNYIKLGKTDFNIIHANTPSSNFNTVAVNLPVGLDWIIKQDNQIVPVQIVVSSFLSALKPLRCNYTNETFNVNLLKYETLNSIQTIIDNSYLNYQFDASGNPDQLTINGLIQALNPVVNQIVGPPNSTMLVTGSIPLSQLCSVQDVIDGFGTIEIKFKVDPELPIPTASRWLIHFSAVIIDPYPQQTL
jgi:hypothetical protein